MHMKSREDKCSFLIAEHRGYTCTLYKQKRQPASISPGESEYTSPGVLGGISREAPDNMTDPMTHFNHLFWLKEQGRGNRIFFTSNILFKYTFYLET